ncbi:MAG: DUF3426 domain-containing protein [Hylemonella sp.]
MSLTPQAAAQLAQPAEPAQEAQGTPESASLSFMRPCATENFWRQTWVRTLLSVLALLLGCGLALQILVQERDRLAAQFPNWQAGLQALCQALGCQISPLRQIESISIESSNFQQVSPGLYRLGFSLKNSALVDLALPALELTVTDVTDQAMIRRVLLPAELQLEAQALAAKSELHASLLLDLTVQNAPAGAVAGYRLLVFYP